MSVLFAYEISNVFNMLSGLNTFFLPVELHISWADLHTGQISQSLTLFFFASSSSKWPSCQFSLLCQMMRNDCSYRESKYFESSSQKSVVLANNTDRWRECTDKKGGLQNLPHSQYTMCVDICTYTYFMEIYQFLQHLIGKIFVATAL